MLGGAQTAKIQAGASKKAAEEATKQAKAKQEELNAQSELSRAIQKINNDRIMRAADKTYAAASTNLTRNRASLQTSNVMTQVAQAEAGGAYATHVASKGIGGDSVAVIENTMALRNSLQDQLTQKAQQQADYDAVQVLAGIIPAGWQQQDMTVISGNQSSASVVPTVTGGFNFAQALGKSDALMQGLADWLSPSKDPGLSGDGLTLPGSDMGLSTPASGFWSSSFKPL